MNDQPPPSKRQRVDPNAMDDDNTLPPKGQSVLGKRKRKYNSDQYYGNNEAEKVEKGVPPNHPQNGNEFLNPNEQKTENEHTNHFDDNQHIPRVSDFQKGHQLDIKITDEHQETFWTTGIICRVQDDKVLIHVPRSGPSWKSKLSDDIAPAGTYTDGLN
eukprot:CAMPEP_0197073232 /NCGR_PEP_ID=MMETSP1384-20130603/210501_1 /TAXON_ID=29189 /ORGANISM="Ammonia sp." /LENGTH=158 /DNA_ID=CAMNT_0042512065 /DNA_START=111 /DNA_END=587 /DNA_ORIENTATION=+